MQKKVDVWRSNGNLLYNRVLTFCLISTALDKEGEAAPVNNTLLVHIARASVSALLSGTWLQSGACYWNWVRK